MAGSATSRRSRQRRGYRGPTPPAARSRSRSRSLPIGAAIAPTQDAWRRRGSRAPIPLANCARTGTGRGGNRRRRPTFCAGALMCGKSSLIARAEPMHCLWFRLPRFWKNQMDKIVKLNHRLKKRSSKQVPVARPSRVEAEAAVRTLIRWAGDNPDREGLVGTPDRVVRAYQEFFSGYDDDPREMLRRTFEEVEGYDEVVVLRDIRLESHCEHHMVPIIGRVHIGYLPDKRVVGISKLARVVDAYAHRLQIQEKLTAQIANTLQDVLQPRGVAVVIEAAHQCMTTPGGHKPN